MLESLMQNPVAWVILSICTVLGTIFGIWGVVISRKKKEISYTVNSFTLVEKNKSTVPKLMLLFDNQEIESLTATTITLWNSGNDEIRREDIVKDNPLILSAPDTVEILDVQVMKRNEKSNHFSVEKVDGTWTIDFEYMNKKEGAVLQVYHTGPADKFALDCKIIGGKPSRQLSLSEAKMNTVAIYYIAMIFLPSALYFVIDAAGAAAAAVVAGAAGAAAVVSGAAAFVAGAAYEVAIGVAVDLVFVAVGVAGAVVVVAAAAAAAGASAVAIAGAFGAVAADVVAKFADSFPYFAVSFACTALILLIFLRTQNNPFSRIPDSLK